MDCNKGYVLVIVLLILALTTAVVVDFAGIVYGYVSTADNFAESERMSLLLKSAYLLAAEQARDLLSEVNTDQRQITYEDKLGDTTVGLTLEDNNSKFNVNLLVFKGGRPNNTAIDIFKRLLKELGMNEDYADRLVDYIDPDKIPRVSGGENNAKNDYLFSLSELSYIFPEDDLKKVKPYLTVYGGIIAKEGTISSLNININTADLPLLKALHPEMSEALAKRIIEVRESKPFEKTEDLIKVLGDKMVLDLSGVIKEKSTSFNVVITAQRNDLVETAEAGFDLRGGSVVTKYWRER